MIEALLSLARSPLVSLGPWYRTFPFMAIYGKVQHAASMETSGLRVRKGRVPTTVNGKVPPRRLPNAERCPREYLTPEEVERLITAARKRIGARTPHRDASMILMAYRHGLRASELRIRSVA